MIREYLVEMRERRGETQSDAARAIGLSRQYYWMIEQGRKQPKMDIAIASLISLHFDVPLETVVDLEREWRKKNDIR